MDPVSGSLLTDLQDDPRPREAMELLVGANLPAFMSWESPGNWRWHRLYEQYPQWQLALWDDDGVLVGALNAVPLDWDGSLPGLGGGFDDVLVRVFDGPPTEPTAVCLLSISVVVNQRGQAVPQRLLAELKVRARREGWSSVVAPLRPTRKDRHPEVAIADYAAWVDEDGTARDPWLRTHLELGAEVLGTVDASIVVRAPVARWESVAGPMPDPGAYHVPGALAPVVVDGSGVGTYAEPNVWIRHPVD